MLAWIEGFAIFLAVFIVVFVGSYNDYKKEDQFFKLYALDQEGKFVSDSLFIKGLKNSYTAGFIKHEYRGLKAIFLSKMPSTAVSLNKI